MITRVEPGSYWAATWLHPQETIEARHGLGPDIFVQCFAGPDLLQVECATSRESHDVAVISPRWVWQPDGRDFTELTRETLHRAFPLTVVVTT